MQTSRQKKDSNTRKASQSGKFNSEGQKHSGHKKEAAQSMGITALSNTPKTLS